MTEFINYQTFSNLDEASNLIEALNKNQIQFEIDDSALHFDVVPQNTNPMENGVVIKIREEDRERVDKIFQSDTEKDFIFDHYFVLTSLLVVGFWKIWKGTDNYAWNPQGEELQILETAWTSIFFYKRNSPT